MICTTRSRSSSRSWKRATAKLQYDPEHGYLPAVLALLQVPVNSQTLVFSKTSFQYPKISPEHPRALYFNDDVYVGSVHDGKAMEIVSFDAMQGAIFYLLDERKSDQPGSSAPSWIAPSATSQPARAACPASCCDRFTQPMPAPRFPVPAPTSPTRRAPSASAGAAGM